MTQQQSGSSKQQSSGSGGSGIFTNPQDCATFLQYIAAELGPYLGLNAKPADVQRTIEREVNSASASAGSGSAGAGTSSGGGLMQHCSQVVSMAADYARNPGHWPAAVEQRIRQYNPQWQPGTGASASTSTTHNAGPGPATP